jgi:hypothetical protein
MQLIKTKLLKWLLLAVITILYFGCTSDPVKKNAEFKGICSQSGTTPYPMMMTISERKGNLFSGVLHWPALHDSKTKITGIIEKGNVQFTEFELIQGSDIAFPTLYKGQIMKNSMSGVWMFAQDQGTFYMELKNSR